MSVACSQASFVFSPLYLLCFCSCRWMSHSEQQHSGSDLPQGSALVTFAHGLAAERVRHSAMTIHKLTGK